MTVSREMDEGALVSRAQQGCEDSFVELMARCRPALWRAAIRISGSEDDALDICQETIIRLWKGLQSYRSNGHFVAWARTVAVNEAIRWVKRRGPVSEWVSIEDGELEANKAAQCEPVARIEMEGADRRRQVESAMESLSASQRVAFVLRHFEEKSVREIAQAMDCTEGSVKRHLFRAMEKLRRALSRKEV